MNKKLTVLLSLGAAICLAGAISACADVTAENAHTHTFSDAWESDSGYHWHAATCGHDVTEGRAAHTFDGDVCSVCGYPRAHVHSAKGYESDADSHWKQCEQDGEIFAKEFHTFESGVCTVCGEKETVSKLAFELDPATDTYTVTGRGEETGAQIVVPARHLGKAVTKIGAGAFSATEEAPDTTLTGVSLPDSVTEIGESAFAHCRALAEADLGGVQIFGESSFQDTALEEIGLDAVVDIGESSFYQTATLRSVTFGEALKSIGRYGFNGCPLIEKIVLPDSLVSIGNRAFYECAALSEVTFGEGLESIGVCAFTRCNSLTEIELPEKTANLGESAFSQCAALERVAIKGKAKLGDSAFYKCTALEQLVLGEEMILEDGAFYGCTALSDITFGPVLHVEPGEYNVYTNFYNIAKEVQIHFNGTIEQWCALDGNVFRGGLMRNEKYYNRGASKLDTNVQRTLYINNKKLEGALTFPADVETVPAFAFLGLRSVTSLTIPKSLKSIGEGAFEQVSAVDTLPVIYQGSLTEFCSMQVAWLVRCAKYAEYTVGGVKLAGELAIPDGVTKIPAGAFYAVQGVTSVSVPTSVKTFGLYALTALEITEIDYAGTMLEWNSIEMGNMSQGISYCGIPGKTDFLGRPSAQWTLHTTDQPPLTYNESEFQR